MEGQHVLPLTSKWFVDLRRSAYEISFDNLYGNITSVNY